jgi:hypothetical protein
MNYHRFLIPGEILQEGDEGIDFDKDWVYVWRGDYGTTVLPDMYGKYRREIPQPCTCGVML